MDLAGALESFNRKERNLFIRAALGHQDQRLPLSDTFCARVRDKLKIELPRDPWWATDYHFDWLAGALCLYVEGPDQALKRQPNHKGLVKGSQEDIDLIIATGEHLIMIEAKYGNFDNCQMASKLERLELLHRYYLDLPHAKDWPVQFHLLLTSPREPKKLVAHWPSWACREGEIPWIRLVLNHTGELPDPPGHPLRVTRCDQAGKSSAKGDHWCVVSPSS